MIKILIVEDQTMLKDTLEHILNEQDDMEVIGGTDDAAKAPQLCKELKPDLVLMDLVTKSNSNGLPSSGIRYTAEIRKEQPEIKVVVMTGLPEITFAEEAKNAGAHSFIKKDMDKDHLLYVIRSTMKGSGIYPASEDSPFASKFTEREIAVIRFICQGIDRNEMAKMLNVSVSMVNQNIASILNKSGFDTIAKFAVFATSQGFIAPDIF